MNEQLLFWFVAGCCYLNYKMLTNSFIQAYGRFRYKSFFLQEDEPLFQCKVPVGQQEPDLLMRAGTCWRNDLENIPGFMVAAVCGLFCNLPVEVYRLLIILFCLGRTVQTACLLRALQPWRTVGFFLGQLSTAAMYVWCLRSLL